MLMLFRAFTFSEKANLAVTLISEANDILGHAAFFDYPNWDYTDQAEWETWLKRLYDNGKCTVRLLGII